MCMNLLRSSPHVFLLEPTDAEANRRFDFALGLQCSLGLEAIATAATCCAEWISS